jgi:two-component system sensor histidine kinase KdpD
VNTAGDDLRPDPDRLLAAVQAEEAQRRRGRLKIFFGACPGVGKTYAMLQALHERRREGVAVLLGVVETHGRSDTEALLQDLPRLPSRSIDYRGRTLSEFDLDAALASDAALIAIDELAHSNGPGSRHAKRWQDVTELLDAGFDVYTTLNVQHLESLHDVVAAITGIRVRETVPDHVFDRADEVTLIDLSAEDLIKRLHARKVYMGEAAQTAIDRFFRPGNLIALRELALRRVAERVDAQMRAYRSQKAIEAVWPARERLLVAVGDGDDEPLLRSAARLATRLEADWIVVHVDRTAAQTEKNKREQVMVLLSQARRLGAEVSTVAGDDVAGTLVELARERNANRVMLGWRPRPGWKRLLNPPMVERIRRLAPDIEVSLIGLPVQVRSPRRVRVEDALRPRHPYLWASVVCAATTLIAWPLSHIFDLSNIVMLFLLAVVLVSLRWGRRAGAWAALLAVLCFDFFFVPPQWSFAVSDSQYLFTFMLMLAVALIIGQLTARLRFAVIAMRQRERRSGLLMGLSNALSGALTVEQIVEIAVQVLESRFEVNIALAIPDADDRIHDRAGGSAAVDLSIAQWVLDRGETAGAGTGTLSATTGRYLPLKAPMRVRGVLVVEPKHADTLPWQRPEDLDALEACAGQIAVALERVHFVEVARDALVQMEGERMRNTLLLTLSHDLRTPLTGILGTAEVAAQRAGSSAIEELLRQIVAQARAMQRLLDNLLQLAKLQSGVVRLEKQWHSLEEIIGSALRQVEVAQGSHRLQLHLPPDMPLIEVDGLLLERALVNLLDNAFKYTPQGTAVELRVRLEGGEVIIEVADDGPGLPVADPRILFEPFRRGQPESSVLGMGLGLALVERIVQMHGGKIDVRQKPPHGTIFTLRFPKGVLPPEEAAV